MKIPSFQGKNNPKSYLEWEKNIKRLRLTKTKLKDMLEYEQVKKTIKRVSDYYSKHAIL